MDNECYYDFLMPEIEALAKKLDGHSLAEVSKCLSAVVSTILFAAYPEISVEVILRFIKDFTGLAEFLLEQERRNKV